MATVYTFENLIDGADYGFPPSDSAAGNVLRFSNAQIGAADVVLVPINSGSGTQVIMTAGIHAGKTIFLTAWPIVDFAPENTQFADNSWLLVGNTFYSFGSWEHGDDSAQTPDYETAYSDLLMGLGGNDFLEGGNGNDTFDMLPGFNGEYGVDTLDGGSGNDRIRFGMQHTAGVVIDLVAGTATGGAPNSGATLTSIEHAIGTSYGDSISGGAANNSLDGAAGADTLDGLDGADTLMGADGADSLVGGSGNDMVYGGAGNDTFVADMGDAIIEFDGEGAADLVKSSVGITLAPNVENLTLTGTGNLASTGNGSANTIKGNSGVDNVHASGGNDTVNGANGNDKLWGGAGNDVVNGGNGNDALWGDAGADRLNGGDGTDTLYWNPTTSVTDTLVDGGGGTQDVLLVQSGTLNLTTIANSVIKNVEKVKLAGMDAGLILNVQEFGFLSSDNSRLIVMGDADNSVTASGGWAAAGTQSLGGQTYDKFTSGAYTLLIDADIGAVVS